MSLPSPYAFAEEFALAFSSGELSRVLAHYTADAVILGANGAQHRGVRAIADVLAPVLYRGAIMTLRPRLVVELADIALVRNDFEVRVGDDVALRSASIEVLRRDGDRWRLAIDHPYAGPAHEAFASHTPVRTN